MQGWGRLSEVGRGEVGWVRWAGVRWAGWGRQGWDGLVEVCRGEVDRGEVGWVRWARGRWAGVTGCTPLQCCSNSPCAGQETRAQKSLITARKRQREDGEICFPPQAPETKRGGRVLLPKRNRAPAATMQGWGQRHTKVTLGQSHLWVWIFARREDRLKWALQLQVRKEGPGREETPGPPPPGSYSKKPAHCSGLWYVMWLQWVLPEGWRKVLDSSMRTTYLYSPWVPPWLSAGPLVPAPCAQLGKLMAGSWESRLRGLFATSIFVFPLVCLQSFPGEGLHFQDMRGASI